MLLLISDAVTLGATPRVFFIRVLGQVIKHAKSCLGTEAITNLFHVVIAGINQLILSFVKSIISVRNGHLMHLFVGGVASVRCDFHHLSFTADARLSFSFHEVEYVQGLTVCVGPDVHVY
jgi:hypothetical protein